jgi:hypothetical protein
LRDRSNDPSFDFTIDDLARLQPFPLFCRESFAVPVSYGHRLLAQEPIKAAGGLARIVDSSNFPAATTIAAAASARPEVRGMNDNERE